MNQRNFERDQSVNERVLTYKNIDRDLVDASQ